jgi:ABC-type nitrate/sulfonate/bicarbonate transport system substrate-binding protein
MKTLKVPLIVLITIAIVLLTAGCTQPAGAPATTQAPQVQTEVDILYSGFGTMPTLMASKQIDAYIAWQPFVEVAPMAGFGKVLSYTGDLPPEPKWKGHPCCVLIGTTGLMKENPDLVNAMSALMIYSTDYINAHQDESGLIVADWLAGKANFTYGNISISSEKAMTKAIYTVNFTNEPTEQWKNGILKFMYAQRELGVLNGTLQSASDNDAKDILFDTGPYQNARQMIQNNKIITPHKENRQLGFGYLLSDHDTMLFVAVKKWQYFNDTYGIALKPRDPTQNRPEIVDLIVNGVPVAEIKLISAEFGGPLMQLAATDAIQFSIVGNPPVITTVDKGNPVKILMAANLEGSGVVVASDAPVTDWPSFFAWAKARADAGKPLRIADPGKGSIQDILLKYSMKESGITIKEVK